MMHGDCRHRALTTRNPSRPHVTPVNNLRVSVYWWCLRCRARLTTRQIRDLNRAPA